MSSFVTVSWIPNKMVPYVKWNHNELHETENPFSIGQRNSINFLIVLGKHIYSCFSIGFVSPFGISQPCAKQLASDFIP